MGEYVGIWRFRLRPDTDRAAFERQIGVVGRFFAQVPGVRQYTLHRRDPAVDGMVDDYITIERWESPEVHTRTIQELMKRIGDPTPGASKDAYDAYTASREMCESARYESFLPVD
jgi:hypothetical protein